CEPCRAHVEAGSKTAPPPPGPILILARRPPPDAGQFGLPPEIFGTFATVRLDRRVNDFTRGSAYRGVDRRAPGSDVLPCGVDGRSSPAGFVPCARNRSDGAAEGLFRRVTGRISFVPPPLESRRCGICGPVPRTSALAPRKQSGKPNICSSSRFGFARGRPHDN